MAERDLHHITRIDIEPSDEYPDRHSTHGWQVRARRNGTRHSKFFSDSKHGGKEAAVEAAIKYRDELLKDLPEPDSTPRKAWSNTGVVGLSVREKEESSGTNLYVQLNWMSAEGTRRAASFSVNKWGLRRALWNGCLRLYRERSEAGYPVEEPHVMFARAQEPFKEEIQAEKKEEAIKAKERAFEEKQQSPEAQEQREEQVLRSLEDALFG